MPELACSAVFFYRSILLSHMQRRPKKLRMERGFNMLENTALWRTRAMVGGGRPCGMRRRGVMVAAGMRIDRRHYFEHLLKRQLELEAREAEASLSCPIECVREVYNYNELEKVLQEAEKADDLVIVDFYSPSCGACKYLLPQVVRLCKKGCTDNCSVDGGRGLVFLKHNVRDEYDELTDLARFYMIRSVPVFTIFRNGSPIENVVTRDKQYLQAAMCQILGELSK